MEFKRITTDARQMGGVPCLRGLRIPVATVVSLVAEGQTVERILALYPDLEAEDVREALFFAAEAVRERTLPLAAGQLGCSSTTRCRRRLPTFCVTPVTKPSLILFREEGSRTPEALAALMLANLAQLAEALNAGCIVTFEPARLRVRALPISS